MYLINMLAFLLVFINNSLLNRAINVISSQLDWQKKYLLWSAPNNDELTKMFQYYL